MARTRTCTFNHMREKCRALSTEVTGFTFFFNRISLAAGEGGKQCWEPQWEATTIIKKERQLRKGGVSGHRK